MELAALSRSQAAKLMPKMKQMRVIYTTGQPKFSTILINPPKNYWLSRIKLRGSMNASGVLKRAG